MRTLKLNDENEILIWRGKKAVLTSVLDALTNRFVLLSMAFLLLDILIFSHILVKTGPRSAAEYLMKNLWIHYLPLVVYLAGVLYSALRSASTDYAVTNKYVYVQYGLIKKSIVANDIDDLEYVSLSRDLYDRMTKTADITVFTTDEAEKNGKVIPEEKFLKFENIREADEVYALIEAIRKRTCAINDPAFLASLKKQFGTGKKEA